MKTGRYEPAVDLIADSVRGSGTVQIVDLCSGAGGPVVELRRKLADVLDVEVSVTLTDKYPNAEALAAICADDSDTRFDPDSVDAMHVPQSLCGFRTMFTAFHHFIPVDASQILRDAAESNTPIGIFELADKGVASILRLVVTIPLGMAVITPFLRPFRLSRVLLTYVLPIIPLCTMWDGIVSILRVYSPEQLSVLTAALERDGYEWRIGTARSGEGLRKREIIYLLGAPTVPASA